MFCQKCGFQNPGNSRFCQKCGAPLPAQPANGPTGPSQQQAGQQMGGQSAARTVLSPSPVLNELKKMGCAPLFLAAIIVYSAALLFQMLNAVWGSNALMSMIFSNADLNWLLRYSIGVIYSVLARVLRITALISLIPPILITVGLWLTYVYARDRKYGGMKTIGLTIIKVIVIINMACYALFLLLIVFGLVVVMANVSSSATPYLLGVLIGCVIGMGVYIFYYMMCFMTINSIKRTIATGMPDSKSGGSAIVAIMNFVLGGLTIIGSIFTFMLSILGGMQSLCAGAAMIVFGIFLLSYRSRMRMLRMGSVPPPVQPKNSGAVQPSVQSPVQPAAQPPVQPSVQPVAQPSGWQQPYSEQSEDSSNVVTGEMQKPVEHIGTTVLSESREDVGTTVLNVQEPARVLPYLQRDKTGEKIYITTQVFRIGKDAAGSDYCISDNSAISRKHAKIVYRNGEYFIIDEKSTNHVYVNGGMIPSETEIKLGEGMKVRLGNEDFVFHMS